MLYRVWVNERRIDTGEEYSHECFVVARERQELDARLRWVFDVTRSQFTVVNVEKIREKIHFISSKKKQDKAKKESAPVVSASSYNPNIYGVCVSATIVAKDEDHALRKMGSGIVSLGSTGFSHRSNANAEDFNIKIEAVPAKSQHSRARDVSNEINKATFVRG